MRYEFLKKKEQSKFDGNLFDRLNNFTSKLKNAKEDKSKQWMKHSLKFHIDS